MGQADVVAERNSFIWLDFLAAGFERLRPLNKPAIWAVDFLKILPRRQACSRAQSAEPLPNGTDSLDVGAFLRFVLRCLPLPLRLGGGLQFLLLADQIRTHSLAALQRAALRAAAILTPAVRPTTLDLHLDGMGDPRIPVRARRAIGALNLLDNDFVYGLSHSLHRACVEIFQAAVACGLAAIRIHHLPLDGHRQAGQIIGRVLAHTLGLRTIPVRLADVRRETLPYNIQPRQLAPADLARLGHMIPHAAGELVALLLQLVQQLPHLLHLLGDLRGTQRAGTAVGVDQAQLPQCRGRLAPFPDAGHLPQIRPPLIHQLADGRRAPMAGDDHHMAVLAVTHPNRLLQADGGDVVRQRVQITELVEIVLVFVQKIHVYVLDLLSPSVRIGHRLRQCLEVVAHFKLLRHRSRLLPAGTPTPTPDSPATPRSAGCNPSPASAGRCSPAPFPSGVSPW